MTNDPQIDTPAALSFKPDDDELALAIAPQWRECIRFLYEQWHMYENGCWVPRSHQEMQMELRNKLRELRRQSNEVQITISQPRVTGIAKMLQSDLGISDREINALQPEQELYINLQNGLYNLDTFTLEKHRSSLRITTQLAFEYDASAICPTWERFLNTSLALNDETPDDDLIALTQEALAYSMTARTDMKASFWLVGKPDSGKSTLIAFLRGLMGSLHGTIDLNELGKNKYILAGILGKRVVTFTEADDSVVLPDSLYKAMVGGTDEIWSDVKFKSAVSFKPIAKFWWAMNSAPRMKDRSGATMNRLKVIPFNRSIPVYKQNRNLYQQLMQERAGIFNWLLDGYVRLIENGAFTVSQQSEEWRRNYQLQNDTEKTFVHECCEQGPNMKVQAIVLYRTYKRWCEMSGFRPKNMNQVAEEWVRLGFHKTGVVGKNFWHGLQIHPEYLASLGIESY